MGKIANGFGYVTLAGSAFLLGVGYVAHKLFWSTPAKRTLAVVGGLGILVATQCGDELKQEYNQLKGIPELKDSLRKQQAVIEDQEIKNKARKRELTEIKYLANKKSDSLSYQINMKGTEIAIQTNIIDKLKEINKMQKSMYTDNLETIMNQNKIQENKLDSLYNKLDNLIENKAPVSMQKKVYESILNLK